MTDKEIKEALEKVATALQFDIIAISSEEDEEMIGAIIMGEEKLVNKIENSLMTGQVSKLFNKVKRSK